MRLLIGVVLTLGLAGAATASVQSAPGAAPPVEDKRICKRIADRDLGSNLRRGPSRVCKKESEWKAERADLQRELDNLASSGNAPGGGSPSPAAGPSPN